jgi:ATP-dependent helicase HrpB
VKLASGTGAVIGAESGVVDAEFLVAVDVRAPSTASAAARAGRHESPESVIRIASRVEAEWLHQTGRSERLWLDDESGEVRAARIDCYDAITLRETPIQPDDRQAAAILADAWLRRAPGEDDARLLRRLRFAGLIAEPAALVARAARGRRALRSVRLADALDEGQRQAIERDAPDTLKVPSGRLVRLDYTEDGGVAASVKLQELFGLAETPRIGLRREPVLLALLAPNGRPVQVTRDLRSFWERTYPEVRRELRGRYPRHPWPEDPWNALPTARTVRRSS